MQKISNRKKWYGEIPNDWKVDRIGSVFKLRNTKVSDYDYRPLSVTMNGIVPQLESAAKTNAHDDRKLVKAGDFAINSRSDRRGACGISNYDGSVSLINTVVTPMENINSSYYDYLFHSASFADEFYKWGHGIVDDLWTTGWGEMKNIRIPIPPIKMQEKIANYLNNKCKNIDELIQSYDAQIIKLEYYKKCKVKEIFDFYINNNSFVYGKLRYLSKSITKQTGFDYTNTISPALVGKDVEDTIPYLQTRHFKDNYFNYETEYYIPMSVANQFPNIILRDKCLLFSIVGASIGNVAVYPGDKIAFLGGAICKVDLVDEYMYSYVKNYMMSVYGQEQILLNINSSAQGTITVQNVRDFKIPIFNSKDIYKKIADEIDKISLEVNTIINKKQVVCNKIKLLKKALTYEYVTGKKSV